MTTSSGSSAGVNRSRKRVTELAKPMERTQPNLPSNVIVESPASDRPAIAAAAPENADSSGADVASGTPATNATRTAADLVAAAGATAGTKPKANKAVQAPTKSTKPPDPRPRPALRRQS